MASDLERINEELARSAPSLFAALSPLGRETVYPPGIPFQAAQARDKRYNATIGQLTDGRGRVLALPALTSALESLTDEEGNRALLYSPMEGLPELRRAWQRRQRPQEAPPSSLPLVTVGLTHGLSIVADLFAGPGRRVLVPAPFWGNYRQIFAVRTGAILEPVDAYRDGEFLPRALGERLAELPEEEAVLVLLNVPSNPGGFAPGVGERRELVDSLLAGAERRPVVVVCDDAYAGLVYDDAVPRGSLFWDLSDRSPGLVPIKVDGATKELVLFGGRVGFLTFPFGEDSPVAAALESKVKCLVRSTVGSPVAVSQVLALRALRDGGLERQIEAVRQELARRLQTLQRALSACDPELLRPLPANAGAFALVELPEAVDPERLRRHLLASADVGIVSVAPRYVRIAFCSVQAEDLPILVERLEQGVRELL